MHRDSLGSAQLIRPGASPGQLSITGNAPMSATSRLEVDLAGLTVGSQYDRLAVGR